MKEVMAVKIRFRTRKTIYTYVETNVDRQEVDDAQQAIINQQIRFFRSNPLKDSERINGIFIIFSLCIPLLFSIV
ncbi:hypothetical protein L1987_30880 [Smallanthus sonchifolius]|uniref:Uncharacterized protein n=1 Tax=Smallanthus sonchifolius TaxID=185202 RepID=A0ACB9I3Z6_9ASTR|nr:hypothetical protein L1987_30880 [Smallanthus sonchifolius]